LASFSDNPCFLIEENFQITKAGYLTDKNTSFESNMLATSYFGILETLRKMGLGVYTTRDLNQSIWWMIGMHGYLEKNHYPKHRKYFSMEERAVGMLSAVPGISEARAKKMLKNGSIAEAIQNGKVEGLTELQGRKVMEVLKWKKN
jgi:ERCC4-type nuclease